MSMKEIFPEKKGRIHTVLPAVNCSLNDMDFQLLPIAFAMENAQNAG